MDNIDSIGQMNIGPSARVVGAVYARETKAFRGPMPIATANSKRQILFGILDAILRRGDHSQTIAVVGLLYIKH